jgi:hypothetical protein
VIGYFKFKESFNLLLKFSLQAILQFGAEFSNLHACAYQEFATEQFVRLVFIQQLSSDAAILTILIPAEPSVWNRFRADVLKGAQDRVLFRNLESLSEYLDFDESFVGSKYLRGCAGGR